MASGENAPGQCSGHGQLMEWILKALESIGSHKAHIETSLKNDEAIFAQLRSINESLAKREALDSRIEELCETAEQNKHNIAKLQATVDNGLTSKTKRIDEAVSRLEKRFNDSEVERKVEDAAEAAGIGGFLSKSWEEFKNRIGWVIIFVIVWFVCWGFLKAVVFHEIPFPSIQTMEKKAK